MAAQFFLLKQLEAKLPTVQNFLLGTANILRIIVVEQSGSSAATTCKLCVLLNLIFYNYFRKIDRRLQNYVMVQCTIVYLYFRMD